MPGLPMPAIGHAKQLVREGLEGDRRRPVRMPQLAEEEFADGGNAAIDVNGRPLEDAGKIGWNRVWLHLNEHGVRTHASDPVGMRRLGRLDQQRRAHRLHHPPVEPLIVHAIQEQADHRLGVPVPLEPEPGPVLDQGDLEGTRGAGPELAARQYRNEWRGLLQEVQLLFKTRQRRAATFVVMTTIGLPRRGNGLHIALVACVFIVACGGGSKSPGTTSPPSNTSASPIAGTYQTAVSLTSNSCTDIAVQNNPTVVTHTAGATAFTMTHAGTQYQGTLAANNSFTTAPKGVVAGTATHTLSIAGQFGTNAFTADVTVAVTGSGNGAPCQYAVRWVGTK
jgi:hypothetical protein